MSSNLPAGSDSWPPDDYHDDEIPNPAAPMITTPERMAEILAELHADTAKRKGLAQAYLLQQMQDETQLVYIAFTVRFGDIDLGVERVQLHADGTWSWWQPPTGTLHDDRAGWNGTTLADPQPSEAADSDGVRRDR